MADTGNLLGQVLEGRYQVTAKIGAGGMAHIYRALHLKMDRDVVIKVPRETMLEDPEFAGRFKREIRSLVRLRHPSIVPILDVGDHQGLPFIVLEFETGGSLRDLLDKQGPRPQEELRVWLGPIASALDFCHENQCVHRDVKPDNILFDAQRRPCLSDFGVAKVLNAAPQARATVATMAGHVAGTPHYMAPELIMGRDFDGRIDQYALAVTIFEMLTGKMAITGPTSEAVLVAQVTVAPDFLKCLFTGLEDVLGRALAKDPQDRFESCDEFAAAVFAAIKKPEIVKVAATGRNVSAAVSGPSRFAPPAAETKSGQDQVTISPVISPKKITGKAPTPSGRFARGAAAEIIPPAEGPGDADSPMAPAPTDSSQGESTPLHSRRSWVAIALGAMALAIASAICYFLFFLPKRGATGGDDIRRKLNE